MNLREVILAGHSKANCEKIVKWIGNNQQRFDELVKIFLNDEYIVVQRAGWPLSELAIKFPGLIQPHVGKILRYVNKPGLHTAVKRNSVRLLQNLNVAKKYHGKIMTLCFDYLQSPTEEIAVKAFSLTVLHNLRKSYPEIKQELKTIIEDRWEFETAAFHSRAKKILKEIG